MPSKMHYSSSPPFVAQVLLAADNGMSDDDIAASVDVGTSTVYRIKRAFVEEGLEKAHKERAALRRRNFPSWKRADFPW